MRGDPRRGPRRSGWSTSHSLLHSLAGLGIRPLRHRNHLTPPERGVSVRRKHEPEGRSLPFDALGPDPASVRVDDGAGDGQPDAGPAVVTRPRWIYAVEPLEHQREVLLGDPGPGVLHGNLTRAVGWDRP